MSEQKIPIPARLYNAAVNGHVAGTEDIIDDIKNKTQRQINSEVEEALGTGGSVDERIATEGAKHYLKSETYTKEEVNGLITTPNQEYVSVTATDQTTAATDVLPATGEADTVYRVGNWDGSQYDTTCYTEYAWNGSVYVSLNTKEYGMDDAPTTGSNNLVKSGGVYSAIKEVDDKIEGATVEVEVDYEGTYEHQYFAGSAPYLQTYYLASSINSLVAFPITKDEKYKIDIPKSPNYYSLVAVYSNILPVDGQATPLYDSSSSAVVIPTETGDANPMTINIDAADDYSYIIVCYQTDGGVPTCITETETKGIKEEIGNLNELTTTNKTSLVAAINEIKATDDTLSKEGEAADAKAVGVAINGTTSKIDVTSTDIYANEYFGSTSGIPNTVIVNYNTAVSCSMIVYPLIFGAKYELHIPKTQVSAKVWAYLNELPIAGQQKYCEGRFVDDTMGDDEGMDLVIDAALDYKYLAVCYIPNSGVPTLKRIETSGGVYSKIGNLEALQTQNKSNLVAAINEAANTPIEICLPDKIYAVVGDTLQLFLRSFVKTVNPYNYSIKITCNKGLQFNRYFEYTPIAGDVGTTDFTITVRNNNGVLLGSKTCSLVTAATPTSPSNQINIASFGDSLSGPGKWQEEACRRLIGSGGTPSGHGLNNIAFVGNMTQEGWLAHWCGYGGWTWSSYTSAGLKCFRFIIPSFTSLEIGSVYTNNGYQYTVAEVNPDGDMLFTTSSFDNVPEASGILTKVSGNGDATLTFTSATKESTNPLWDADNNKMSFIPYANQYCNGQIDVVMTQLGWNGMVSAYQTDFSSVESQVKQFADCLHSEFPNAKLKILGLALPSQNGACGSTYALTTVPYSDTYGLTVNVININKLYQQIANESGYSDFVEYIPVAQQFDAENSYPVNVRLKNNRLIIKPFAADGYYQIGDIVKHENNFYVCISEGIVGQWENVYHAYLPYDPYERYDWNAVHPSDGGYNQMADAVYRNIVANYCQDI